MSGLAGPAAFGRAMTDSLLIYLDLDQSGLGPTPPAVAAAVCGLLGLPGPAGQAALDRKRADDIYALAADSLARFRRDDPSGRAASIFVAYVSTFFHEARHVHDLLSTGFGLDLLAAQFNYYQNALPLAGQLRQWQGTSGQPVPLPVGADHPALPALAGPAAELITRYGRLAERMERAGAPDHGIHSWVTDIHLLEASAGVVQMDITHDLFGDEGMRLFYGLVQGSQGARKYMWLINDFIELAVRQSPDPGKFGQMLAFLLWASLQGCRADVAEAELSPVAVFQAAADFVTRRLAGAADLARTRALFDEFCGRWGLPPPADTLAANRRRVEARAASFVAAWQAVDPEAPAYFADIFAGLQDTQAQLTEQIRQMPEIYFVGRFYAHAILMGRLPGLRIDFKLDGTVRTAFTPGRPCLDPAVWEKAARYSAILSLLLKGRGNFPIPHLEEQAFQYLGDELGLVFADMLFQ